MGIEIKHADLLLIFMIKDSNEQSWFFKYFIFEMWLFLVYKESERTRKG